jgi:hypothetical protein
MNRRASIRPKNAIPWPKLQAGLRVRILALSAVQCVPWHHHSNIADTFLCMRGPMRVRTREPERTHTLHASGTLAVLPGTPHYTEAADAEGCQFLIVQGVGEYDYISPDDWLGILGGYGWRDPRGVMKEISCPACHARLLGCVRRDTRARVLRCPLHAVTSPDRRHICRSAPGQASPQSTRSVAAHLIGLFTALVPKRPKSEATRAIKKAA